MAALRLFIAIPLPGPVRGLLARDGETLRRFCRGSFTREENYHLTLVFLGETEEERLPAIIAAMDASAGPGFPLRLGPLGRFPGKDGGVLWRGLAESDGLMCLQAALSERLREEGFRLERRPYCPHLTLARKALLQRTVKLETLSLKMHPSRFRAREMILFSSAQRDGKRVYTPLHRTALR